MPGAGGRAGAARASQRWHPARPPSSGARRYLGGGEREGGALEGGGAQQPGGPAARSPATLAPGPRGDAASTCVPEGGDVARACRCVALAVSDDARGVQGAGCREG